MGSSRQRWRDYTSRSGRRPVKAFIEGLPDTDAAAIAAAMKEVAMDGRSDSRGGETVAKDFLEEIVEERSRLNAEFPATVDAALKTRLLLRDLAERRRRSGLSQTVVAARMGTSQSALARLESGETDPRISTAERYARAIGEELASTPARQARASRDPAGMLST